jgi:glycosyltransferase involved in cell wall biosynthesis
VRIGVLTSVGRTLDAFFPEIVAAWEAQGHHVFCAAGTVPASDLTFDRIDGLTQRPGPGNAQVPGRLVAWARDRRLDVVVTNTATASMLVRLRRMPCKVVYFCHGLHWNTGRHPAQLVERALARRADSIITINSDDHAWLSRHHPDVLLLEQGVGVPEHAYAWSPLPDTEGLRLVWAGDFVPRKRPDLAVEVCRRLLADGTDVRLTMLGDGPLRDDTMAAAADLGDRVSLPGRTAVEEPLRAAHALLHTATWEGLPRILLEGMVMGRRAYAFDVKGVRDVPHAVLAPDGDVGALAALLGRHRAVPPIEPAGLEQFRTPAVAARLLAHLESVVV